MLDDDVLPQLPMHQEVRRPSYVRCGVCVPACVSVLPSQTCLQYFSFYKRNNAPPTKMQLSGPYVPVQGGRHYQPHHVRTQHLSSDLHPVRVYDQGLC